jgi:DNA-binding NarL/FixJ family response regulator
MIRVVIADDQALMRAAYRMIFEGEPDIELVGEACEGAEAVRVARATSPEVVIMDVRMPGLNGIEATRALVAGEGPAPRVIMLTTFDMDEYVYDALRAGASGFLLKDLPPEQLVQGIRAVCRGESLLSPAITRRMIETFHRPAAGRPGRPGRPARAADPPGTGGAEPTRAGPLQPRDRGGPVRVGDDGQDACPAHPGQAQPARSYPGGDLRL